MGQLFWFGRSNCHEIDGQFYCDEDDWLGENGWNNMLRMYLDATQKEGESSPKMELLWLRVPHYTSSGLITDIEVIYDQDGSVLWTQNDDCAGKYVKKTLNVIYSGIRKRRL